MPSRLFAGRSLTVQPQRTDINASVFVLIALMLLVLPFHWIIAAVLAAAIHEFFHYFALRLLCVRINRLEIGLTGAIMDVEPMPPYKELICALAGPVGGLCLLLFSRWIPRISICAAVQSFYNLLPLYPLDGGRALRSCIRIISPDNEEKLCSAIQMFCLICISLAAIYATFWIGLGVLPLLFATSLWMKTKIHLANSSFWDYNSSNLYKR